MEETPDPRAQASEIFARAWQESEEAGVAGDVMVATCQTLLIGKLIELFGEERAGRMLQRFAVETANGRFTPHQREH